MLQDAQGAQQRAVFAARQDAGFVDEGLPAALETLGLRLFAQNHLCVGAAQRQGAQACIP